MLLYQISNRLVCTFYASLCIFGYISLIKNTGKFYYFPTKVTISAISAPLHYIAALIRQIFPYIYYSFYFHIIQAGRKRSRLPASIIKVLKDRFPAFLDQVQEGDLKAEYLLPMVIDDLVKEGKATVRVLPTHDRWYGMTYQEDRAHVEEAIRDMIRRGIYKEKLFG